MTETRGRPWYKRIGGGGAIAAIPLLLGFALRLWYALQADPFVDEPTTLLAARAIATTGLPTLPSGLFYGNDLPFSYLAGGVVALIGSHLPVEVHLLAVRLLSVAAAVLAIGLVYLVGRRFFSPLTAFFAALLLALSSEAVLWGGRARAYALLGLLAFSAISLFCAGLSAPEPRGARLRRLGLALLVVATFVHPEAALLLPAVAVGAALVNGWRWWLRPARLAELLLTGAGIAARYGLQIALARGWIGGFATVAGSRPPLGWPANWLGRIEGVRPFFLDLERVPWTLLALLALALALASGRGIGHLFEKVRSNGFSRANRATLFLSACLWLVPLGMLLLLGGTYQSPRYLSMLLPIFALLAGQGLALIVGLLVGVGTAPRRGLELAKGGETAPRRGLEPKGLRAALAGLAAGLLLAGYLPSAVAAATYQEKGFRPALEYVARQRQAGDRVATVAPAACQLALGHCDFFALGIDYEEFVYRDEDGRLVDRWLGSPLIRSAAELEEVLDQAKEEGHRLWLVVDEGRFRRRFEADFAQAVWLRAELAAKMGGVMVFRSCQAAEPATTQATDAVFGGQIALVGYELGWASDQGQAASPAKQPARGQVVARQGDSLPLTLYWQAVAPPESDYHVFVHLVGADGGRPAQDDGPPLDGLQPTSRWLPGEILPDRRVVSLPADLAAGLYRLEVGLYGRAGEEARLPLSAARGALPGNALILDYIRVPAGDEGAPVPAQRREVLLSGEGDEIRLLGYTLPSARAKAGGSLELTLYWQAVKRPAAEYTVLLHLLDAEGEIWGQGDGPPLGGFQPTSFWDPGEVVADGHAVSIRDDAPPGTYRLVTGLYQLATGRRLAGEQGDLVVLAEIEIGIEGEP